MGAGTNLYFINCPYLQVMLIPLDSLAKPNHFQIIGNNHKAR